MELLAPAVPAGTLRFGLAVVAIIGVVWLVGLTVALHGATPKERASIIRAYGRAFPWRPRPSSGEGGRKD